MKNTRNIFQKILCAFLLAALLVPMFVSCADSKDPGKDTTAPVIDNAGESGEDAENSNWLTTGLERVNMQETEFVFLSANWGHEGYQVYEIWAEESTGEGVNDGIYDRIVYMEDNFNCSIRVEPVVNSGTGQQQFTQSIVAQDYAFDFYIERINNYQTLASQGYLYDLDKIPHVDYSKIYWDTNSYDAFSIANIHFAVCSDITILDKHNTSMILFNKELYTNLQLPNPYQMVLDGTWTQDVLFSHMRMVSEDLNGDSIINKQDRFGFLHDADTVTSFLNGSGFFLAEKNAEDVPELTLGRDEVMTRALEIMNNLYDESHALNAHKEGVWSDQAFANNQALYMWSRGGSVVNLREMETDFGILPIPKATAEQENYYSDVNTFTGICMVLPVNLTDDMLDWTGIFMEEYACQGRNFIIPEYYDNLLTSKVVRDEESSDMLDIIFANRVYDIGAVGNWLGYSYNFCEMTKTYNTNISSFLKSCEKGIGKQIGKMVESILDKYDY